MRPPALLFALAELLLAPRAYALPWTFTGTYTISFYGGKDSTGAGIEGIADVNANVSPPSFVIPAGLFGFGAASGAVTPTGATSHQFILISNVKNAQGTFDFSQSGVRKMPLSGMLKFKRMTHHFAATAAIEANYIGAAGMATATFDYVEHGVRGTGTFASPTTTIVIGTAMLTGQSFEVTKDSRTAAGAGHIQMVAPFSFKSSIATRTEPSSASLALDFAPEPDLLALGTIATVALCGVGFGKRRHSHR
jgi:hypothetical protein